MSDDFESCCSRLFFSIEIIDFINLNIFKEVQYPDKNKKDPHHSTYHTSSRETLHQKRNDTVHKRKQTSLSLPVNTRDALYHTRRFPPLIQGIHSPMIGNQGEKAYHEPIYHVLNQEFEFRLSLSSQSFIFITYFRDHCEHTIPLSSYRTLSCDKHQPLNFFLAIRSAHFLNWYVSINIFSRRWFQVLWQPC